MSIPPDSQIDSLFDKWKDFLGRGDFKSANSLTDGQTQLAEQLDERIRSFLDEHAISVVDDETTQSIAGLKPPPKNDDSLPVVPAHTVVKHLGSGGMGDVYEVVDVNERHFALKIARIEKISKTALERFYDEAKAIGRLSHPNIVKIHHFFDIGGNPAYLMQIYPRSLRDLMKEWQTKDISYREKAAMLAAAADALGYIHAQNLIHRDIKPNNILVDAQGRLILSDFGLVKNIGSVSDTNVYTLSPGAPMSGSRETKSLGNSRERTVQGSIFGTRKYMAPEQSAGLNQLANAQWDVFSFGVMMHEIFTGHLPASSAKPYGLLDTNTPSNLPAININPKIPPELNRIVNRCIARDPAERYLNGSEIASDLRRYAFRRQRLFSQVLVGTMVLLVCAIVVIAVGRYRESNRDWSNYYNAELKAGRPVTLIGGGVMPKYYQVKVGEERVKPYLNKGEKAFALDSNRRSMVELMKGIEIPSYRFECQMKKTSYYDNETFGMYSHDTLFVLPKKKEQEPQRNDYVSYAYFCRFTPNDKNGKRRMEGMTFALLDFLDTGMTGHRDILSFYDNYYQEDELNAWHDFAMEVKPDRLRFFSDGVFEHEEKLPNPLLVEFNETVPRAGGGLGFYFFGGTFFVKKATITPLD